MTAIGTKMLPYIKRGEIDYAALEYNPDEPEPMPEAMEQEFVVHEILNVLASRFADFGQRPDVFISSNTILCHDPANLNVRRQPDIYLAFGLTSSPSAVAGSTCPGRLASPRILLWRWVPKAPARRIPSPRPGCTPTSAFPNTGASTPAAVSTTGNRCGVASCAMAYTCRLI